MSPLPNGGQGGCGSKHEINKKMGFCWFQVWERYGNTFEGLDVCFGCLPCPIGVKGEVGENLKFTKRWDFAGFKYGNGMGTWLRFGMCDLGVSPASWGSRGMWGKI